MADAKVTAASKGLGVDAIIAQSTANISETKKSFGVSEQFKKYMHQSFSSKKKDVANDVLSIKSEKNLGINNKRVPTIKEGKINSLEDKMKLNSTKDILNNIEGIIKDIVKEQFDVSDEEIDEALSNLGFNVLNLLDPKNLADFVANISNEADVTNLLLGQDFRDILGVIKDISKQMQDIIGITSDEVNQIASEVLSDESAKEVEIIPKEFTQENLEDSQEILKQSENVMGKAVSTLSSEGTKITDEKGNNKESVVNDNGLNNSIDENGLNIEVIKEDDNYKDSDLDKNLNKNQVIEPEDEKADKEKDNTFEKTKNNILNRPHENVGVNANFNPNKVEASNSPQMNVVSYMQGDKTLVLIEKITNNIKVVIQEHATTMEMQLEPENLGKLYLQVTAKDGAVHAQISAQNEAIKNILANQIVALEENLKSSGVKVEAIDVTVASHNFEQNLEQNNKRDEENANILQGNLKVLRRNIKLDSLDSLAGIMTEEEQLVAQIMKDNGNSVDLTA
ncbi:flagellar hook-length control protein FliK [Lachnobacterium bovis]|uniref:flagellar hook-length control protein FliK n=1 Tax=Lachnobacterium bovis TaxID=140626 RepID=UPI000483BF79|nr:flagellar hook-length control protein FliK [Lachnobacterium bovis]